MLNIFARSLILYGILVIVMRIMGKRQLGELQPFELVITISIAELASIPMQDVGVPLLKGIIPIFALVIAHMILTYIQVKFYRAGNLISGSPILLINKGEICQDRMKSVHLSIDDLMESIRQSGYLDIKEVAYAIMENNGTLSIFPKETHSNKQLPIPLIMEGQVIKENIKKFDGGYKILSQELQKLSISEKQVYYAYIDNNNDLTIIPEKKMETKSEISF